LLNQLSLRIRICLNEQPLLSEIRFGVVIPQGWSYDFPRGAETADLQKQIKNQGFEIREHPNTLLVRKRIIR